MKFLCVPCDKPMQLSQTVGPDNGSISLVYACDDCGYEMAMLTNAHETQVVSSLGVTMGPDGQKKKGESKCPFTGIAQEMTEGAQPGSSSSSSSFAWTPQAEERLESIPAFVRPMARSGIEGYAKERGLDKVDETLLAEARAHFGM
jgi:hypothetical protein